MKRYAILALAVTFMIVIVGCATPKVVPPEERHVQYIIDAPGKSQAEIYRLCNEWMVKTFKSAEAVIQYQDKEEGIIVGKGQIIMDHPLGPQWVWVTLTLEMKDDRARMTFEDMYIEGGMGVRVEMENEPLMELFKSSSNQLRADLESYINKKPEDW